MQAMRAIRAVYAVLLLMVGVPLYADSGSLQIPIVSSPWGGVGSTYTLSYQESDDGSNVSLVLAANYVDGRGQDFALYWFDGSTFTPCAGFNHMLLRPNGGSSDGYGISSFVGHFQGVFPANSSLVVKSRNDFDDTLAAYNNNVYPNSTVLQFFPHVSSGGGGGGGGDGSVVVTGGTVNVTGMGYLLLTAALFTGAFLVRAMRP